ncbi:MAG: sortase domain-bontaining protein [Candidatus Dojkabacteria bacterium]
MKRAKLLFITGCLLLFSATAFVAYTALIELERQKAIEGEVLPVESVEQKQGIAASVSVNSSSSIKLPKKDLQLPQENIIRIAKLGVDTEIFTGQDSETALRQGAWIAPEFKTPSGNALLDRNEPVIIASHVYGYSDWTDQFRDRVSFAGLGKLEQGDLVEVIWQQRRYTYEIIAGEKSEEISNYDTDLILYTCEDLSGSDIRVIKYAKLRQDLI